MEAMITTMAAATEVVMAEIITEGADTAAVAMVSRRRPSHTIIGESRQTSIHYMLCVIFLMGWLTRWMGNHQRALLFIVERPYL